MSIKILPARLANQIAAGEVVERPASVVKELIENSLDAGATRIEIEIEQGGAKCIRIKDNGKGVSKEELTLALSRHATSKISHLDDLEAIVSLGFRGEALASVSSVSRLTFTSKPVDQEQAWQAIAEGRDMAVNIQPAAHPQGTTVEVLDLFFNTPARRRFLKTEKTEFQHIDELIKRIALSRFDIAITLKHNNKIVRQYRAAPEQKQQEKRIAMICSEQFMQHALFFEHADQSLSISGWVSDRLSPRSLADVQYCYINGRMIRDKLVNHAIKQVYSHFLPQGTFPGYIIYIECDAKEVDVNVHPSKHEVRFHQARWVHDFISSTLNTTLNDSSLLIHENTAEISTNLGQVSGHAYQPAYQESGDPINNEARSTSGHSQGDYSSQTYRPPNTGLNQQQVGAYCDFVAEAYQQNVTSSSAMMNDESPREDVHSVQVLSIISHEYVLIQSCNTPLDALSENGLLLMSLRQVNKSIVSQHLLNAWKSGEVISQPLLLPVRFKHEAAIKAAAENSTVMLSRLGFTYKFQGQFIIVSQVPTYFRHAPIAAILPKLFIFLAESNFKQTATSELVINEESIDKVCAQLAGLLIEHEADKLLSKTEIGLLLESIQNLFSEELLKGDLSAGELARCFIQPDLSLLIQGVH